MEDIRPYDLCIERAPESGAPYLSRGKCHMRNGSHAAAKADFEKALSLPLDPNVPPDERGIYYDRPEEADAHLQLGAALVELGDLAGAEPHMDRGVQLEPREPAYTARGAVRLLRDDLAGARADLDRALELDARSERARRHRARQSRRGRGRSRRRARAGSPRRARSIPVDRAPAAPGQIE